MIADEFDRQQHEGGFAYDSRVFVFEPRRKSEREVEDVDPLLLFGCLGFTRDLEKLFGEPIGTEPRLQLIVGVAAFPDAFIGFVSEDDLPFGKLIVTEGAETHGAAA